MASYGFYHDYVERYYSRYYPPQFDSILSSLNSPKMAFSSYEPSPVHDNWYQSSEVLGGLSMTAQFHAQIPLNEYQPLQPMSFWEYHDQNLDEEEKARRPARIELWDKFNEKLDNVDEKLDKFDARLDKLYIAVKENIEVSHDEFENVDGDDSLTEHAVIGEDLGVKEIVGGQVIVKETSYFQDHQVFDEMPRQEFDIQMKVFSVDEEFVREVKKPVATKVVSREKGCQTVSHPPPLPEPPPAVIEKFPISSNTFDQLGPEEFEFVVGGVDLLSEQIAAEGLSVNEAVVGAEIFAKAGSKLEEYRLFDEMPGSKFQTLNNEKDELPDKTELTGRELKMLDALTEVNLLDTRLRDKWYFSFSRKPKMKRKKEGARAEYLHSISIPSTLISKNLGDKISKELSNGEMDMVSIILDCVETLPHFNAQVGTNGTDKWCESELGFVKNFKGVAQILEEKGYTKSIPQCIIWYCPEAFILHNQCKSQYINHVGGFADGIAVTTVGEDEGWELLKKHDFPKTNAPDFGMLSKEVKEMVQKYIYLSFSFSSLGRDWSSQVSLGDWQMVHSDVAKPAAGNRPPPEPPPIYRAFLDHFYIQVLRSRLFEGEGNVMNKALDDAV